MVNKYKLVIFDVDGTLLDTSEGLLSSAAYAIEAMGYEVPSSAVLRSFIGPPMQDSFAKTFGAQGQKLKTMADCFRQHYKDVDLLKASPYKGILDLFKWLSKNNFMLAIATYKRQDYAETIVRNFGFDQYTQIICGSDFAGEWKKKDIIVHAVELAGLMDYGQAVMIGDTVNDAIGAAHLGMDFIAVTYGFGYQKGNEITEEKTVGIADEPMDIMRILQEAEQ